MINTGKLAGCTLFITGASRGIGKSIALKAANDGANIVLTAQTAEPHPKLPGTIYTAAAEIEKAGGKALPCVVDVRDETQVVNVVKNAVEKFGGIDILINNESAISLTDTLNTEMKKYDLMNNINTRGAFLVSKVCIPYLLKSKNPHIINISPPLNIHSFWFKNHLAYTIAKYGMSMCVLGMAEEFKGLAINSIWPKTASMETLTDPQTIKMGRKSEIMADAAYVLIGKGSQYVTGNFFIDEDILSKEGVTDFNQYACDPANMDNLMLDFFLDLNNTNTRITDVTTSSNRPVAPTEQAPTSAGKIDQIFSMIDQNINTKLVRRTNAVYQFIVKGDGGGTWYLDLRNGSGSTGKGEPPNTPPDAILTVDSANVLAIFSGKLKPSTALWRGDLKVTGDRFKVVKLKELMKSLQSKL